MKKTKRLFALLLSVVMVLSLLPAIALADAEECEHEYQDGYCAICGEPDPDYVEPNAYVSFGTLDYSPVQIGLTVTSGEDAIVEKTMNSANYDWVAFFAEPGESYTFGLSGVPTGYEADLRAEIWYVAAGEDEETCQDLEEVPTQDGSGFTVAVPELDEDAELHSFCIYISILRFDNQFRLQPVGGMYDSNFYVEAGESVTLEAVPSGKDLTDMTWLGWFEVDYRSWNDYDYVAISNSAAASLTLQEVEHNGMYACRAQDRFGNTAEQWFQVYVENDYRAELDKANSTPMAAASGGTATVKVKVSGDDVTGVTYQWRVYRNGNYVDVPDAVTDTLTVEDVTYLDYYCCDTYDRFGNYSGVYVEVGVENHLSATAPNGTTVYVEPGEDAVLLLQVTADDLSQVEVVWSEWTGSEDISVVGSPDYDGLTHYTAENVMSRRWVSCEITDQYGNYVHGRNGSSSIDFTIYADSGLEVDPGPLGDFIIVPIGGSVTLTPTVSVDPGVELSYNWWGEGDGRRVEGDSESLTVSDVRGRYEIECWVEDEYGNGEGARYVVEVENGLTVSPVGKTERSVPRGASVTLAVTAFANRGRLEYQWYEEYSKEAPEEEYPEEEHEHFWREEIEGADGASLTITDFDGDRTVICVVTDCYGGRREVGFTLTLSDAPYIPDEGQPVSFYGSVGSTATFTVSVMQNGEWDDSGLAWQWYYIKPGEDSWTKVSAASGTTNSYFLTVAQRHNGYQYRCDVTDEQGNTTQSRVVTLNVTDTAPILCFWEPEYEEVNGRWEVVIDQNGDPVYDPARKMTELTTWPGMGWGSEVWYGDHRLTADDLADLQVVDPTEEGALTMRTNEDGTVSVFANDWLPEDAFAGLIYTNTNQQTGNTIPVYTELPRVGAYVETYADKSTMLCAVNPLELCGDDMFYVVCNDPELTITELRFDDWAEECLSCEPIDAEDEGSAAWFVGLFPEFPAGKDWMRVTAFLSNGAVEDFTLMLRDRRERLVWQWADRHWQDGYWDEDEEWVVGRDVYEIRDWEEPSYGLGGFPGMDASGRFALLSHDPETGEEILTPIAYRDLTFSYDGTALSFFSKTDENDGCYNLYFYDFGSGTVTYTEATSGREFGFSIVSDLPDIGFFDGGVLDAQGNLIPFDRDNESIVSLYKDAHLAAWNYDGENDTIYLVSTCGAELTDAHENNGRAGVDVELDDSGLFAVITLSGDHPTGDWLDLDISGSWNERDTFEHHTRGLRVTDDTPHLVVRFTDWDGNIPYIPYSWGDGYTSWFSAAPGEDRVVEVSLYEEDSDHYPNWTEIDPNEIEVISGPATLEIDNNNEEQPFLRIHFTGFGPIVLGWTDEDGTTYTMPCEGELPNIGWYSAVPETEEQFYAYYLSELDYDGTNGEVFLVARNGAWFNRVEADCGSELTIGRFYPGATAVSVQINSLREDRINVRFWGRWNENDAFGYDRYEGRELRVNDVAPGLCFRYTDWDENDNPFIHYENAPETWMNAAPGDRRIVEVYLRGEDGKLSDPIDPAQLTVTGSGHNMNTDPNEQNRIPQNERQYLNIVFDDFGEVTLSYTKNGKTYSRTFYGVLPGLGFYSAVPETEDEFYEYYLTEWNWYGTEDDVVYLAMYGDGVITWVENDCGSELDIDDVDEDGATFVRIAIDELDGDWINVCVEGDWGGENYFDDHHIGLRVNDLRPGYADTGLWAGAGQLEYTVDYGGSVTLEVEAGNFVPQGAESNELHYQWYEQSVPAVDGQEPWTHTILKGETGPTLTLTKVTHAGQYRCVVGDEFHDFGPNDEEALFVDFRVEVANGLEIHIVPPFSVTREDQTTYTVNVSEAGYIDLQPGDVATLEALASATDGEGLRYQWFRTHYGNFLEPLDDWPGTTCEVWQSDEYQCWAIDKFGNIAVVSFNVEVRSGLHIEGIEPPDSFIYVARGEDVTISITAHATEESWLTFAWYDREDWDYGADPYEDAFLFGEFDAAGSYTLENVQRDYDFIVDVTDGFNNYISMVIRVRVADGAIVHVSTQQGLLNALDMNVPVSAIYITDDITVTQDCVMLFDEAHYDNYRDAMLCIEPGVTVTVTNGAAFGCNYFSYDWDTMREQYPEDPTGTLLNQGTIVVSDGGLVENSFMSNEGTILVEGTGTCHTPQYNYGEIHVYSGGGLVTSQGADSVNCRNIVIDDGGLMEARFGSTIINEGYLRIDGEFNVGCVNYDGHDHIWFENYGDVEGSGTILLGGFGDVDLDAAVEIVSEAIEGDNTITVRKRSGLEITEQPEDFVGKAGSTATFTVGVEYDGENELSYQWKYRVSEEEEWTNVSASSGRTASYSLTVKAKHNGYQYYCEITDGVFTAESAIVTLTVGASLTITAQPADYVGPVGSTAIFTVEAESEAEISYQWYVQKTEGGAWSAVSAASAKTASYSLTVAARHNGFAYKCELSNGAVTVETEIVTLTVGEAGPAIEITDQPEDVTVPAGATASFTFGVEYEGEAELSFQWQYRTSPEGAWTDVSAASGKTAIYSLTVKERHNGYQYRCLVTDGKTTVESEVATLTVGEPVQTLKITAEPEDYVGPAGSAATFTVAASGAGELSYQWKYRTSPKNDWVDVSASSGQTPSYSLTVKDRHNGYQYYCEITDGKSVIASAIVTLTVGEAGPAIEITDQPEDDSVPAGSVASFTFGVEYDGEAELSFQWKYRTSPQGDWVDVTASSGRTANYSLTVKAKHNGYQYKCVVTDGKTAVESEVATLTVGEPVPAIEITDQQEDVTVPVGATASFTFGVEYDGEAELSFQWKYRTSPQGDWVDVTASSGRTAIYSLTVKAKHNGYQYKCVVTDGKTTAESGIATLTVGEPVQTLRITGHPEDVSVQAGATAAFTVAADGGAGELSYQWKYRTSPQGDWVDVTASSGRTAAYSLTAKARHNGYQYKCVVTDGVTTVESNIATLTVS